LRGSDAYNTEPRASLTQPRPIFRLGCAYQQARLAPVPGIKFRYGAAGLKRAVPFHSRGRRGRAALHLPLPQAFFAQAAHQPLPLTSLLPNAPQGAEASVGLPW